MFLKVLASVHEAVGWIPCMVVKICVSGEVEAEGSKVQSQSLPLNNNNDKNKMKDPSLTPQSVQKLCPSAKLRLLIPEESLGEPLHPSSAHYSRQIPTGASGPCEVTVSCYLHLHLRRGLGEAGDLVQRPAGGTTVTPLTLEGLFITHTCSEPPSNTRVNARESL